MSGAKSQPLSGKPQAYLGIIGGTGLYEIAGLANIEEARVKTPFGDPSDSYVIGAFGKIKVAFLARHGRGHRLLPAEVNYRANIYGFKFLGVQKIISVNSVGSLREDYRPRDIVLADQFFDRSHRQATFFGNGLAAHISFAHPVCPVLSKFICDVAVEQGAHAHPQGTYLSIEGPAFSTKAESKIYRAWGADVIGMTAASEAKLSREAELCYATLCLVTDYDVWKDEEESVSVELVIENLNKNIGLAKMILAEVIRKLSERELDAACSCSEALKNTIVTRPDLIPVRTKKKLEIIIGKYLKS